MKRTIRWPLQVSGGRLVMTADPDSGGGDQTESLRQIIRLALKSGRSTNAWTERQSLGLRDATFGVDYARTRQSITRIFARLERLKRAKLAEVSFAISPDKDGELKVAISYVDLETQGRERMEVALGNGA